MRRLGELIINLDRSTAKSAEEKKQFDLLMEITIGALINLSKHSTTRSMMREINCQSVLIRVSMQISSIASLLFFLLLDITSPVLCFTTISQCFTQRIKYRLKSLFFALVSDSLHLFLINRPVDRFDFVHVFFSFYTYVCLSIHIAEWPLCQISFVICLTIWCFHHNNT